MLFLLTYAIFLIIRCLSKCISSRNEICVAILANLLPKLKKRNFFKRCQYSCFIKNLECCRSVRSNLDESSVSLCSWSMMPTQCSLFSSWQQSMRWDLLSRLDHQYSYANISKYSVTYMSMVFTFDKVSSHSYIWTWMQGDREYANGSIAPHFYGFLLCITEIILSMT